MAKKTITKVLSDIFLAELSKKSIASFVGLLSLPTLLSLLLDPISTILNTITKSPTEEWQLSIWLFLSSFFLVYMFLIVLFSIKIHKKFSLKRKFLLFENEGYYWKMLLPDRKLSSTIPMCPNHRVLLTLKEGDYYKCSIPKCEVTFPHQEKWRYHDNAYAVGIATLDGHIKR